MRRILAALLACIVASPAWAGSATVNYNSTGSSPFRTTTDGSSNNIGQHTIWDSAAGANGWTIDATHSGWVGGPVANGAAPTQNPIWFAGWDGTDLRGVSTDASGHLVVVGTGTFAVQASVTASALPNGAATSANQDTNSATTAHTCSTSGTSEIGCLGQIDDDVKGPVAGGTNLIGNVGVLPPAGSTSTNGTNTGTTTSITATLAADAAKTEYVCSISIRANAAAAATVNATLSDGTKTFNYTMWVAPNASGVGVTEQIFNPCVPATAINTAWTLTSGAPGTSGIVSATIIGFKL